MIDLPTINLRDQFHMVFVFTVYCYYSLIAFIDTSTKRMKVTPDSELAFFVCGYFPFPIFLDHKIFKLIKILMTLSQVSNQSKMNYYIDFKKPLNLRRNCWKEYCPQNQLYTKYVHIHDY